MKEVTVQISDKEYPFFLELVKKLPFVKGVKSAKPKKKVLADLQESIDELNQIKAGKKKGRDLKDFLNEL
jgi:hypothetical protein